MDCLRQDLRNGTLNLSDLLLSSVTNQVLFKRKLTHSMNDFEAIHPREKKAFCIGSASTLLYMFESWQPFL